MQSVAARKISAQGGLYRLNKTGRPFVAAAHTGVALSPLTRPVDQVHFGKIENITGPIPPKSLVVLVPGMCSPAESMRSLWAYLNARGHSAYILESPFNIRAGSALASTDWLTHGIDRIRLAEGSKRYITLLAQMEALPHEERVQFLCQKLKLQPNELGEATARAALGLMFTKSSNYRQESDFTKIVLRLRKLRQDLGGTLPSETAHKQLYSLTAIVRNQLRWELLPVFMKSATQIQPDELEARHKALEKTVDHIIDGIAPRVVLVGHSMGGFVSMLTLFEQMQDTAMVVGLSAPGENGTDPIPTGLNILKQLPVSLQHKGRELLEMVAPGIRHMLGGSPEADKLKADHQPFNTTIFAVGMPGQYDGLVGEQNFRMNDALPGRINVVVTPKQANIIEMASHPMSQLNQLLRKNPVYAYLGDLLFRCSDFLTGIAYHCGLTQYHEQYWAQNGDILRGIFEAPKKESKASERPAYDYQHGKADYAEAIRQIRRLIDPVNYEAERVHILNVLQDNLTDAQKEKSPAEYNSLLRAYQPLCPALREISQERQPLRNGVAEKAKAILDMLETVPPNPPAEPSILSAL